MQNRHLNRKKWKTALYVRESRDDYGEGKETLEAQIGMLLKFAAENGLEPVVHIFKDNNVSGAFYDRPGIISLNNAVAKGEVDLLLLKDLSRLGRSNSRTLLFIENLEENGVRILTSDGRYDSLTGSETLGIDTWYNERYLADISRKTRSSLRYRIERGDYIGSAPYGYKKSKTRHNKLEVFEPEANIVRRIFRMYIEGMSLTQICLILENEDLPSPGKGLRWYPSTIARIIDNKVYIGHTVQGVSCKVSYKSKKTMRLPEEYWVVTENTHSPVVSLEDFKKAELKRKRKSRSAID